MDADNSGVRSAERARCIYEIAGSHRESLSARHATIRNPSLYDECDNQNTQPLTEESDDGDGKEQGRKGPDHLYQLLNAEIDTAGEKAGYRAQSDADDARYKDDRHSDYQGNSGAEENTAQNIPPDMVGAQEMFAPPPSGRLQRFQQVLRVWIVGRYQGREDPHKTQ